MILGTLIATAIRIFCKCVLACPTQFLRQVRQDGHIAALSPLALWIRIIVSSKKKSRTRMLMNSETRAPVWNKVLMRAIFCDEFAQDDSTLTYILEFFVVISTNRELWGSGSNLDYRSPLWRLLGSRLRRI